jgi:UDP-glucose 6-dehydrogenase
VNTTSMYFAKKTLRKILRIVNKHIRYTGSKQAEAELLIYYCKKLKALKIPFRKSNVLDKLFDAQVKKIKAAINSMHEDLQYDYIRHLEELQ